MKVGILYVKGCAFGVGAHLVSDYVNFYLQKMLHSLHSLQL